MPAVSEAQRRFIYGAKGKAFAEAHHFDNQGKLPARVGKKGKAMKGLHPHVATPVHKSLKDKHAHANHHKHNKAHGTPAGFAPNPTAHMAGEPKNSHLGSNCTDMDGD